jgi:hypothetical protein
MYYGVTGTAATQPVRDDQQPLPVSSIDMMYVHALTCATRFKDFAIRPTLQKLCLENSIHTQFSFAFFANFSERSFLHSCFTGIGWVSGSIPSSCAISSRKHPPSQSASSYRVTMQVACSTKCARSALVSKSYAALSKTDLRSSEVCLVVFIGLSEVGFLILK